MELKELNPQLGFTIEMDGSGCAIFNGMYGLAYMDFREGWDSLVRNNKEFRKEFIQFLRDALDEKVKRDFPKKYRCKKCHEINCMLKWAHKDFVDYEPIRWIAVQPHDGLNIFRCPNCNGEQELGYRHCPNCGQRLLPPEEKMDGKLKPCKCGSNYVHVHSEMRHDGIDGFRFYVRCKGCGKSDRFYSSEEAAIAAWNEGEA